MIQRAFVASSLVVVLLATAVASGRQAVDDPLFPLQWGLQQINAPQAWGYATGKGVTVAVIDGGVNYHHEELRGKVVALRGDLTTCIPSKQRCDDQDVMGISQHGTLVAGIIAARANNGRGVAGVAPEARLISGFVHPFDEFTALHIRWAVDRGARVINMSFGQKYPRMVDEPFPWMNLGGRPIAEALAYAWRKGAVLVAGAANDGLPYCGYPALAPDVLCVGATDARGLKTPYSNFGLGLDLVAPGGLTNHALCPEGGLPVPNEEIISTSTRGRSYCDQQGYFSAWGTSFATPHVSGVAALLLSMGLNNKQVVACMKATATDLGVEGYDPLYGYGLVNAHRAVKTCKK